MRNLYIASGLAAALLAGAAAAKDVPAPTMGEQELVWALAPNTRAMARLYPTAAKQAGVERATVDLVCTPNRRGNIACEVTEESAPGFGFGEAALKVMERGQVMGQRGVDPEGRAFRVTLKFGDWAT